VEILNQVLCGDCLELLPHVADASVDMVMTSPPYDNLRAYKGYSFDFEGVARELYRVVKPGGVVVWVVADATQNGSETGTSFKQALFFKELGFNLHDTMLYHKVNYVPLTHRRYEQAWEYMFCFSKGAPKTFNPIRIPCKTAGGKSGKFYQTKDAQDTSAAHSTERTGVDKIAPNMFGYTVGAEKTGHPAVFPLPLALDQISSWSNPGDVILDPFGGSGTTAVACQQLGRNFILCEISQDYCGIARKRLGIEDTPIAA
jgi:DNA modification methylase